VKSVDNEKEQISNASSQGQVYTIGHSNHSIETFLELLERYEIEVLVDVRTNPFSRFSRQFSHDPLKAAIQDAGLKYLHLGKELGGKPKESEFYDAEGHIDYARIAQSQRFSEGIERLKAGCAKYRVVIMCAEENPSECHRRRLIGPVLAQHGIEEKHIRGNGELNLESELKQDEDNLSRDSEQLKLFAQPAPQKPWRSSRPVKGKRMTEE
jgi:uncharacterized protein (DUF488 family)